MPQWQCRGCRKWIVTLVKPKLADRTCAFCDWKYDPDAPYIGPADPIKLTNKARPEKPRKPTRTTAKNGRRTKRTVHRKAKR